MTGLDLSLHFRRLLGSSVCIITPRGSWNMKEYGERLVLVEESWLFAHGTGFARSVTLHHVLRDKVLDIQLLTKEKMRNWAELITYQPLLITEAG